MSICSCKVSFVICVSETEETSGKYTCIGRNDARLAIALGCCTMPRSAAGITPGLKLINPGADLLSIVGGHFHRHPIVPFLKVVQHGPVRRQPIGQEQIAVDPWAVSVEDDPREIGGCAPAARVKGAGDVAGTPLAPDRLQNMRIAATGTERPIDK